MKKFTDFFRTKSFLGLSIILVLLLFSSLTIFYLLDLLEDLSLKEYSYDYEWCDQRLYLNSTNLNVELWNNQSDRVCRSIELDTNENIIVAGTMNGDHGKLFLIKYNQTRSLIWNKSLLYNGYYSAPLAIDSSDNIYVVGIEPITTDLKNFCLIKFNSDGIQQWIKKWEAGTFDAINDMKIDKNDNLFLIGRKHVTFDDFFIVKYTKDGIREWSETWGGKYHDIGTSIGLDSFGNIYLTGYTRSYGNGGADLCLVKLNTNGNLIFQYTWGSEHDEIGIAIITNSNNQIYIAGIMMTSQNPYDLILLKFMSNGTLLWQKQWGDISNDRCYDITLNSTEDVHVVGRSYYYGNSQIYIVGFNEQGTLLKQGFWNETKEAEGHAIAFNSANKLFIGGKSKRLNSTVWDMILLSDL